MQLAHGRIVSLRRSSKPKQRQTGMGYSRERIAQHEISNTWYSQGAVCLSITCACDNCLPIRGGCKVQHPGGVADKSGQLAHGGVLPHHDLVLAVAVRAHNLVHILAPRQVADLAACAQQQVCDAQVSRARLGVIRCQGVIQVVCTSTASQTFATQAAVLSVQSNQGPWV